MGWVRGRVGQAAWTPCTNESLLWWMSQLMTVRLLYPSLRMPAPPSVELLWWTSLSVMVMAPPRRLIMPPPACREGGPVGTRRGAEPRLLYGEAQSRLPSGRCIGRGPRRRCHESSS